MRGTTKCWTSSSRTPRADRGWAEWLAWLLEEAEFSVLVQAWDMVPGSNWVDRMDEGVAKARRTVAVLSEDYLASEYGSAEWQAAWRHDPQGRRRKLVPVRVAQCQRPQGQLGAVVTIDLVGLDEAAAQHEFLEGVRQAVAGRGNRISDRCSRPRCGRCRPSRGFPERCRRCGTCRRVTRT